MSNHIVIYDTEYTTWQGALERDWSKPNEHKECIQIGAQKLDLLTFKVIDSFNIFIKPKLNPNLSKYCIDLTGITQEKIELEGVGFAEALNSFLNFCASNNCYSWGNDHIVLEENCVINSITANFKNFHNLTPIVEPVFSDLNINVYEYQSGNLYKSLNLDLEIKEHNALNDVISISKSLEYISFMSEDKKEQLVTLVKSVA